MLPSSFRLPSLDVIKPLQQGTLSNHCGLYAAINAARLLTPEHAHKMALWKRVNQVAIGALNRDGYLEETMVDGMPYEAWKLVLFEVYDALSEIVSINYQMRPPVRRRSHMRSHEMPARIKRALSSGSAVLCALEGALNHYSVIAGYTATRWLLHDSAGLKWVGMDHVTFNDEGTECHYVPMHSVFSLKRAEPSGY